MSSKSQSVSNAPASAYATSSKSIFIFWYGIMQKRGRFTITNVPVKKKPVNKPVKKPVNTPKPVINWLTRRNNNSSPNNWEKLSKRFFTKRTKSEPKKRENTKKREPKKMKTALGRNLIVYNNV